MKTTIHWDIADTSVDSGDEAAAFVEEQCGLVNNWGTRGFALFFGPAGTVWSKLPLRIDIDAGYGAAAIRWLPENLVAVGNDSVHHESIEVAESSDRELATIPAELVRDSIDTAKQVAAEYVDTGQRPTSLTWVPIDV